MKTLILNLFLLFLTGEAISQITIEGKITAPDGAPIPFANVLLVNPEDTSLVKGAISDEAGLYEMNRVNRGKYFLKYSAIGFQTYNSDVFELTASQESKNFGTQIMDEASRQLNEIIVRGDKPLYQHEMNMSIINVQSSPLTKGSSVMEVLERSPGVVIDRQSDNIVLNGKKGVGVMVNGKLIRLSPTEIASMLSGMSANNIEKIEILSTPPAKYDVDGAGGMINIVLKKSEQEGTNGSISATGGYALYGKSVISANVNHRKGKFNLYGNFSSAYDKAYWRMTARGTFRFPFEDENIDRRSNYFNEAVSSKWTHNATVGLDYTINQRTTMSVSSILSHTTQKGTGFTRAAYTIYGDSLQLFLIDITDENNWKSAINNINFERLVGRDGKLAVDVDYLFYENYNPSDYRNTYWDQEGNEIQAANFLAEQRVKNQTPIHILVYKADYEKKLSPMVKLQAGAKVSNLQMNNSVKVWYADNDQLEYKENLSYQLDIHEMIHAGYSSLDFDLNKTHINAGLRYEFTKTDIAYTNTPGRDGVARRYGNFFPSLFITRKISQKSTFQLAYNRRISRPAFTAIASPIRFYDIYAMAVGNPALKPTITDNIKGQFQYNDFLVSLQLSNDKDQIVDFQRTVGTDSMGFAKSMNLLSHKTVMLQTSLPIQLTSWWRMQNNVLLGYKHFIARNFGETNWEKEIYLFNFSSTHNIELSKGFSLEIGGYYYSADYNGCYKRLGFGAINGGVKKELKNNMGSIQLSFPDILKSIHYQMYIEPGSSPNNASHRVDGSPESRKAFMVRLTYSKSFGNSKIKSRQRSIGSREERERVR